MSADEAGSPTGDAAASPLIRNAIEISIRLGAIALLVGWCLTIIAPFLGIVVWALIIAIALDEPFEWLCARIGGRRGVAAFASITTLLVMLFSPTLYLSETMISGAQDFANAMREGTIQIPPPDVRVQEWPFVGERAYEGWLAASENLGQALQGFSPELQTFSRWLLGRVGNVGAGILGLVGSLLIAGVLLAHAESRRKLMNRFGLRLAGAARGSSLVALTNATIRSVVQGIVGVAAVQALLAGIGFGFAGVPAAGLWALLVLVAAVVQLPIFLAMVVPVLIGFSTLSTGTAIALAVWCALVGLIDNILKPILFGRGVEIPSLVIFMGAIGGMITMGIIGLFLGAAVLALGFELFTAWLEIDGEAIESPTSTSAFTSTPTPSET